MTEPHKFGPISQCPKCGREDPRWFNQYYKPGSLVTKDGFPAPERLSWECSRCGYTYLSRPFDSREDSQ